MDTLNDATKRKNSNFLIKKNIWKVKIITKLAESLT